MNDDFGIDVQKFVDFIISGWWWILIAIVVAGAAGLGFSYLKPTTYESSSMVVIARAKYLANFDPQILTVNISPPSGLAYLDLANSPEMLMVIYDAWDAPAKVKGTFANFIKNNVNAKVGSDSTVIVLTVRADSADSAAKLANLWAKNFTTKANSLYGSQDEGQLTAFEKSKSDVQSSLQQSEQALVDFAKQDNRSYLQNQVDALLAKQEEALVKQRLINQTIVDANGLLKQLQAKSADSRVSADDALSFTVLRIRFYNSQISVTTQTTDKTDQTQVINPAISTGATAVQIPASGTNETVTVGEQTAAINAWVAALKAQLDDSSAEVEGITEELVGLNAQIRNLDMQDAELQRNRDVAQETYLTLARKTDEIRVSLEDQRGDARISSQALPPNKPISRSVARNSAVGAIAGLFIGMLAVLVRNWLTRRAQSTLN